MYDRPNWIGLKVPGDSLVFWWSARGKLAVWNAERARAKRLAIRRYRELLRVELPDAEIEGQLVMVSDSEALG
jgi:hypothetical protein